MRARLANVERPAGALQACISAVDAPLVESGQRPFVETPDGWNFEVELPPCLYRVVVRAGSAERWVPSPVHDLFEVAECHVGRRRWTSSS